MKKIIFLLLILSYVALPQKSVLTRAQKDTIQTMIGYVNVKTYGAVGDGVTNDAGAFQRAMDSLNASGGGTLFIPNGSYSIGTRLLPYSNISIVGDGSTLIRDTTTLGGSETNYDANTFMIYSASDITNFNIRDLTIQNYHSEHPTKCRGFLALYGDVTDCTFDNLTFYDTYAGIYQTNLGSFTRVHIKNCKAYADYIPTGTTTDYRIHTMEIFFIGTASDCIVENCYTDGAGLVYGTGHVTIKNNIINNSPDTPLYLYGSYNLIDGNKLYNVGKDGIKINQDIGTYGASHDNRIVNNYVENCGRLLSDGGTNYQVSGENNVFSNNTAVIMDSVGYACTGKLGVSIGGSNSVFSNNLVYSDIPIDSQRVAVNGFAATFDYGNGFADNVTINNNIITGVGHGIYANEACDNWNINNNYINARVGIESPSTTVMPRYWNIVGNTIKDTTTYTNVYPLLYITNMTKSLITGNVIYDDSLYANDNPEISNVDNIIVRDGDYIFSDNRQKTSTYKITNPTLADTVFIGRFDVATRIDSIWFSTNDSVSVQIKYGDDENDLIYGDDTPIMGANVAPDSGLNVQVGYWNLYGCTFSSGEIHFNSDSLQYFFNCFIIDVDKRYVVEFIVSDYTSGEVYSSLGTNEGIHRTSAGTFLDTLLTTGNSCINIIGSDFVGSIDSISVREISASQIIADEIYFSTFNTDEIPADSKASLYFTNIDTNVTDFKFKIYWRGEDVNVVNNVNGFGNIISVTDTTTVTDGYVLKYVGGAVVWSPDVSTAGSGLFNPDGVTIDTTTGGLARVLPAKVTKWDSVSFKQNKDTDLDNPDIPLSVVQDSLTAKANTAWFAISPTLIDDSIAVKMNRSEMTGYSATSHTHIEFSDTVRVGGWSIGMGNTDLDTLIAGSFSGIKLPNDYTVTEVAAYTNSGTVTFNIEERAETTPNTSGTDVMTSDLVADTDQQETGIFSNATLDRNDWLILTIVSISGEPTILSITVRGVKTD